MVLAMRKVDALASQSETISSSEDTTTFPPRPKFRQRCSTHSQLSSRPSFSTLTSCIVTLTVGPTATAFTVHKTLLCSYSHYFRARLNGSFLKSGSPIADLSDTSPPVFAAFLDWLYFGRLPQTPKDWTLDDENDDDKSSDASLDGHTIAVLENLDIDPSPAKPTTSPFELHLVNLYYFAHYFAIPLLCNALIRRIHLFATSTRWIPWFTSIQHTHKLLPASTGLCRLWVEMYGVKYTPGEEDEAERRIADELPGEFWCGVLRRSTEGSRDVMKSVDEFLEDEFLEDE